MQSVGYLPVYNNMHILYLIL